MTIYEVVYGDIDDNKKRYYYASNLDLCVGGKYKISSSSTDYTDPVTVTRKGSEDWFALGFGRNPHNLVVIANAVNVNSLSVPDFKIKLVKFDKNKMVTVVKWDDDTVTKVKCSYMDPFDEEKAIALCYMKRWCFDNRSCFNNVFKKYCNQPSEIL